MTGPGAGSRGLCVGYMRTIAGRAAGMLPRRSQPSRGPAWGPLLFTDLAIGRELSPVLRGPAAAARPSELGEVGACCQVMPPPPASWRKAAGKDAPAAPLLPVPAAHGAPQPPAPRGAACRPGSFSDGRPSGRRPSHAPLPSSSVLHLALPLIGPR